MLTKANHHTPLSEAELADVQSRLETAFSDVLEALRIDRADPNCTDTPKRWAKMIVREALSGRFTPPPKLTTFPNTAKVDEVITVGPIAVRSLCSHHFVPIMGECWIGIIPGDKLLGLSKYARIANWCFRRPQIQEEAAMQLADYIEEVMQPVGLGVIVRAKHLCMSWRGVEEDHSLMGSSVMRGAFRSNASAREELMNVLASKGFS